MDVRTLSRGTGALCLIVGTVAFAVPTTVTEKELNGAGQLSSAADHLGLTELSNVLVLGIILLVPAMIYAARLARAGAPKLAFFGGGISALAWLSGLIALAGTQTIVYYGAKTPGNGAVATVLDKAGNDPVTGTLTLIFVLGHVVGLILLGAALWRSRAVPVWAAIALIVYPILHLGAHIVGSVALDDVSGIFLVAAGVVCAIALLRMPNATWDLPAGHGEAIDRVPVSQPVTVG